MQESNHIGRPYFGLGTGCYSKSEVHVPADNPSRQFSKGCVDIDVPTSREWHSWRELCIDQRSKQRHYTSNDETNEDRSSRILCSYTLKHEDTWGYSVSKTKQYQLPICQCVLELNRMAYSLHIVIMMLLRNHLSRPYVFSYWLQA